MCFYLIIKKIMNFDIILACLWIFLGELYGNFVWWGSLVTQIFLQNIIWFDIKSAIALDNAAVLWSEIGLIAMLLKNNKIEKWMWVLVWVSVIWALIWANLLSIMPADMMKILFTLAIIGIVLKNFFPSKQVKPSNFIVTKKSLLFLSLAILFIAVYNAFLSIWDFLIGLLILTSVFHFPYHRALFLITFVCVFTRAVASAEYFRLWLIDVDFYIPMFITALIAWLIAWYFVQKIHNDILNKILKYLSIFLAFYLIIDILL